MLGENQEKRTKRGRYQSEKRYHFKRKKQEMGELEGAKKEDYRRKDKKKKEKRKERKAEKRLRRYNRQYL